ncbi:nucleolin isoform X1 [Motacilla alba alba]|uniref:nucleolin isoform X1 n=1 Tax=Motacilla alba alba TaxID=1094192 RepID=UPI0018D4DE7C|nr:nucleolin isoform X1 [Motacilla alba alba]
MVKITKTPKNQIKQKKMAPPPKKFEESEEEESSDLEESSGEEMIPQKKPQKVAVTPAKKAATPAKKVATPAKKAVTPAKKVVATPQPKKAVTPTPKKAAVLTKGAKNGKNAKKEESEEEDDDEDDDEDEEEDEEDSDEEEEPPMPVKPAAKKPAAVPAKKPAAVPAKQESEEEDEDEEDDEEDDEEEDESEDEAMDTAPVPVKKTTPAKAAPVKAKAAESEDEEDDEEDDDEDDDEEEEDEEDAEEESEDEKPVKEAPGKRKKEMTNKSAPEPKKKKTDGPISAFSVFVGNLVCTKEFEELKTGLREFFGKKNIEVVDVRIGASKRFGYVDFSSAEDLDKALQMNGKKLMGLEIKLEKAKSKEAMKEDKKERDARTLFLKNLPYRITEDDIREVFENALEVRIVMNKDGNSKGMAYVEFKTEAEANKALEEKQGTEIEGRAVVIDFTGEKSQQDHHQKAESKTLIVNNLSYAATEETLQEVFKKASSIKVPQNNQGRPKGYAFVDFPTAEDAREALNSYNNTEIEGRTIRLEFSSQKGNANARGGGFGQQSKTLFVRGLSEDTTEETLRESFEGSISARIVTDRDTGSSKGFGFVDFSSAEDAKAAKEAMEDGEIDGNKVTLDFAKPKGDFQRGGGFGGRGGRGGGRGGRGGFGGRGGGRGGFGGRGGGFRGGRGGGGDHKPQGKKIKFE